MNLSEAGKEVTNSNQVLYSKRVEFRAIDLTTNRYLTEYTQVINLSEGTE